MIDKSYEKFANRDDALLKLLDVMPLSILNKNDTILIAISNGGLFLADKISNRVNIIFDFLFTQPIFSPKNPECEIAVVSENMDIFMNETLINAFDISYDFVYGEAQRKYEEKILPDIYKFRKGEVISSLSKKSVVIVDDGIDTGLSVSVAIKTCIKKGASNIIIATPVICYYVAEILDSSVDTIYSVYKPKHFVSTKYYYKDIDDIESSIFSSMLNLSLSSRLKI